jgi:hypothetical protein
VLDIAANILRNPSELSWIVTIASGFAGNSIGAFAFQKSIGSSLNW